MEGDRSGRRRRKRRDRGGGKRDTEEPGFGRGAGDSSRDDQGDRRRRATDGDGDTPSGGGRGELEDPDRGRVSRVRAGAERRRGRVWTKDDVVQGVERGAERVRRGSGGEEGGGVLGERDKRRSREDASGL